MPRGQINGFDYRIQRAVSKSRKEWIQDANAIMKAGGRRVVESGDTLILARDKVKGCEIAFEVHANIPVSA